MLIYFKENTHLCVIFCLLFFCIVLLCGAVLNGGALDGDEAIQVFLIREEIETENTCIWYFCASSDISGIGIQSTIALLLHFEMTEGWEITSVYGMGMGSDLTVTVGKDTLLLDGTLKYMDENMDSIYLLCIEASRSSKIAGDCEIRLKNGKDHFIYYTDVKNGICKIPYTVCSYEIGNDTEKTDTAASTDQSESSTDEEISETAESLESQTILKPVYVGCQETSVRDGRFSVRFLFFSDGAPVTPVICMKGGGVLFMEISNPSSIDSWNGSELSFYESIEPYGWYVCTFRNLSVDRIYDFWVYTENGAVCVQYENGRYRETEEVYTADIRILGVE